MFVSIPLINLTAVQQAAEAAAICLRRVAAKYL
jgi:hypothetical protein